MICGSRPTHVHSADEKHLALFLTERTCKISTLHHINFEPKVGFCFSWYPKNVTKREATFVPFRQYASKPDRARNSLFSKNAQAGPGGQATSYSVGIRAPSPEAKRPESEADHLPLTSASSYTCTTPYIFRMCMGIA